MSETRYVQHKSGQGEKFRVDGEFKDCWLHYRPEGESFNYYLPKSEYLLCDPPEEWEDVTVECEAYPWCAPGGTHNRALYLSHDGELVKDTTYRLRKIRTVSGLYAFIVEKRK